MLFAISTSVVAHPADQSEMTVKPAPHELEARFTFNLLTVTNMIRVDADGDGKLAFDELKAAEPVLTDYLNQHVKLEVNQKPSAWGSKVRFDYLWPNAAATPPMPEMEYAARYVDVTFTLPVEKLLEDFWIAFEFFEQTGTLQTIRGMFHQNGEVLEVPFSFQEPEYTYDTGFAEDPFVQEAEKKAREQAMKPAETTTVNPWWWLTLPALVLLVLWRSRAARHRRT
jgi:hypothetical protein